MEDVIRSKSVHPAAPVHRHNQRVWDAHARQQQRFSQPVLDRHFAEALRAIQADPWFEGRLAGARVLCLGSGGGRQSVLYAAAGAEVTVVDISPHMLDLDRQIARQRRLDVRLLQASIDDLSALPAASFELVVQPVSSCYVPDVAAVYRQVARVVVAGGIYVSQHKQPASLQCVGAATAGGYALSEPYYRSGPLPPVTGSVWREEGTLEFLHRWEQLIGGLCRAGFVVEDLSEPRHAASGAPRNSFADRCQYLPPYVRVKARRR